MKPIRFSNIFASALVLSMAAANAGTPAAPAPAAAPEPASNWISLTLGGAFVDGDDAAMMARTRTNGDFYGGISDLHYTRDLGNSTTLTLDGHALPGLEDYEFGMLVNKEGLGYLKLEYDQFRTWYDASGGYSSLAGNQWVVPFDDERSIDRGEFSLEAGLRMENLPEVTFRYTHSFRDGQKDSTAWGDNQTATRLKLVPSLWSIDEQVDIFELDVTHTLGKTDLGVGLTYEHSELSNTRGTPRGGANGAGTGYNQVYLTEGDETDLFSAHIHGVTRFSDTAWLSYAAAYSSLDSDIEGGARSYVYGADRGVRDYQYSGTSGGSNMGQFIANLNFMWTPVADLTITPSLRYEYENVDTTSRFNASSPVDLDGNSVLTNTEMFNATTVFWKGPQAYTASTEMDATNAAVDVRYKGISDLVLYGTAEVGHEEESINRLVANQPTEWLGTEVEVDEQEFTLGANWYPVSNLSFSLQGLYENRDQALNHRAGTFTANPNTLLPADVQAVIAMPNGAAKTAAIAALPAASLQAALATASSAGMANNLRPIMVGHETDISDMNLRATWRPLSNLSFVTRYDYRVTEYENQGVSWSPPGAPTIFAQIESGEVTSHVLSESVTWSPIARMYVQGTMSWVSSETDTPMSATTPNTDNDYVTAGLSVGYAIDDRTDITASYNYYGSSDYNVVASSMGYGYNTEEHAFSVTLSRMITENMLWNLSYGYITSNTDGSDQTGGFNDFDAHMISTGLQIRF